MKDHEATPNHNKSNPKIKCRNGSECKWFRQGRCNFNHEDLPAPNVINVKECRNGETCQKKAKGKCFYYHKDVGVQQTRHTWSRSEQRPNPVRPSWDQNKQQENPLPSVWQQTQPQQPRNDLPPVWQRGQQQLQQNPLPPMWQHSLQVDTTRPPPMQQAQAWCRHGGSCSNGRYCELRNFKIQDFIQLQMQMRS